MIVVKSINSQTPTSVNLSRQSDKDVPRIDDTMDTANDTNYHNDDSSCTHEADNMKNNNTIKSAVAVKIPYYLLGCTLLFGSIMVGTKSSTASTHKDSVFVSPISRVLEASSKINEHLDEATEYDNEAKDFIKTRSLITKNFNNYIYELEEGGGAIHEASSSTRAARSYTKNPFCQQPVVKTKLKGKKGIGIGRSPLGQIGQLYEHIPLLKQLNTAWNYNWSIKPSYNQPRSMEFIPMIWTSLERSEFMMLKVNESIMPLFVSGNAHRILGFNEPDAYEQAGMTVSNAISKWKALDTLGIPLVSPACVNALGDWMLDFMQRATDSCLRVDYIGVHWYGSPNATAFALYMERVYNTYKIPLMITEFAPADWAARTMNDNRHSQQKVLEFMKTALPWLERTKYIAGYAWFSFPPSNPIGWSSSLFDSNGQLNTLGKFYKSVTNVKRSGNQTISF